MTQQRFDLNKKVAVITGGTGVLGQAMLKGLLEHGATGIVIGRNENKISQLQESFKKQGFKIKGYPCDVLNEEKLLEVNEQIKKEFHTIDILINAAGGHIKEAVQSPEDSIFDIKLKDIKRTVDLNLFGTVYPTLIFGKTMVTQGTGSVINISSMASERAVSRVLGYSLAKSGIDSLTKWLSMEFGRLYGDKVRVNAIAPGFFISEQNRHILTNKDGSLTKRAQAIIDHTPAGRLGIPKELVSTLIWLCSDESRFVSGTIVPVDGGFSKFSGI